MTCRFLLKIHRIAQETRDKKLSVSDNGLSSETSQSHYGTVNPIECIIAELFAERYTVMSAAKRMQGGTETQTQNQAELEITASNRTSQVPPSTQAAGSNNDSNASKSLQLVRFGDSARMARAYTSPWHGTMPSESIPTVNPRQQVSRLLTPLLRNQNPLSTFSQHGMRLLIPRWSPISFNEETVARARVLIQHSGHSLTPETQPLREVLPRTSPRISQLETGTMLTMPQYRGYLARLFAAIHLLKNLNK